MMHLVSMKGHQLDLWDKARTEHVASLLFSLLNGLPQIQLSLSAEAVSCQLKLSLIGLWLHGRLVKIPNNI